MTTRLAVLGSPIAHSLSPKLHRAAYEVLGLDWQYEAVDVTGDSLAEFVGSRDESWRGLSLTMPLKRDVLPLLTSRSALVDQTGSANTILFDGAALRGFNTDVYGITAAFERHRRSSLPTVMILGGGATASSAIVASAQLNAKHIVLGVRAPERAQSLRDVAAAQGIPLEIRTLDELVDVDERVDAVVSTLPNGAEADIRFDPDTVRTAVLFDVGYHPWPTALASAWTGDDVIGGLEMLVLQALAQVRIFVNGDPHSTLNDEDAILAAMLASVGL
jgi:shikimate dehydrogenase